MDKIEKSQILKLCLMSTLLIIVPLLPSSFRTTYLYFVVNLLIIALGAEAGLLSFFSKDAYDKKIPTQKPPHLITTSSEASFSDQKRDQETIANLKINSIEEVKKVEKSTSEKIKVIGYLNVKKSAQKCPSTPSLFFIGGGGGDQMAEDEDGFVEEEEDEGGEEVGELSGQELFNKSETFIWDFYKQLKMQREESWNRVQDIYHKPL